MHLNRMNFIIKSFFVKMYKIPAQISLSTDKHSGIHLKVESIISQFGLSSCIESVINNYEQGTKSIWVHLNFVNLQHIGYLCNKMNFQIHHALKNQIVAYRWVSSLTDLVTPYSMFYLACGAVVMKDDHILLIQEKNGPRKGLYGIPGGRLNFTETLSQCAQRQLRQQTGIKATYQFIIYFRQLDNTLFGGSDFYFICMMKANDETQLTELKLCQRQISDYKWVHLSKFEAFANEKSVGTQRDIAKYLSQLYHKGYNFQTKIPNTTLFRQYISPLDEKKRTTVEHLLIQTKL